MLDITAFLGVRNTIPCAEKYSWKGMCDLFEDASQQSWDRGAKLSHLAYIPGLLSGPRAAANVVQLSFGSYDIDLASSHPSYIDFPTMKARLDAMRVAYILATSTKSLAADHRYRLILRFERPVSAEHHRMTWHHVNDQFGTIFDRSTHDPSRLSCFPACWTGVPKDTRGRIVADWPEEHAYQAFACNRGGDPLALPDFAKLPPVSIIPSCLSAARSNGASAAQMAISPAAQALLDQCAAAVPAKGSEGYFWATSPRRGLYIGKEPFGKVPGGRMFRFLCRVAARAFRCRLPIDADLLFDLATAVNRMNGGTYRPDLRREVERALVREAEFIAGA